MFAQSESGEEILSLKFDDFEFSSATTTDNLLAASSLNLYTWDFEVTKHVVRECAWTDFTGGLRYAYSEQSYFAERRSISGTLLDGISYNQWVRGIGPTASLAATQLVTCETNRFARARSGLFGNHKSNLTAAENLNQTNPVLTRDNVRNGETLTIL